MNQEQVLKRLYELQDLGYQKFHSHLIPGANQVIGVRMPALRALAKAIVKDQPEEFLRTCPHDWYEQSMLSGMVLAQSDFDAEKVQEQLDLFLPYVNNWAVCDCTANQLKIIKKNKAAFWDWILAHLDSTRPFTVRFCICLLMGYYLEEPYIDRVLEIFRSIRSEDYYVNMGLAWALCECLIKYYPKTLPVLEQKILPSWVQNKTIQKAVDSFRITEEQKTMLRSLRIKETLKNKN